MALWAIGDLHLSNQVDKPMDVFGTDWNDHQGQMQKHWDEKIGPDDTVLIPGDISWAMNLHEATADLAWIGERPGKKVMIRGNHDYWWSGISKVRSILPSNVYAIQNDAIHMDGLTICGTRGWLLPSHPKFTEHDDHIFRREVQRLQLSLEEAKKLGDPIVVMIHYPPANSLDDETPFTYLMDTYQVALCVYGHLHGSSHRFALNGTINNTKYQLVSCDYLQFAPMQMAFDS
jgi:uncharacterized protein